MQPAQWQQIERPEYADRVQECRTEREWVTRTGQQGGLASWWFVTCEVQDTQKISRADLEPDMDHVGGRISCPDITCVRREIFVTDSAPATGRVRSSIRGVTVSGAPTRGRDSVRATYTGHVSSPETALDNKKVRSRFGATDTGNVGTADPASDILRVRLKSSATYSLSVRYHSSRYNSLSDTLGVREMVMGGAERHSGICTRHSARGDDAAHPGQALARPRKPYEVWAYSMVVFVRREQACGGRKWREEEQGVVTRWWGDKKEWLTTLTASINA
ncbi:hypothetical protein K438DRAFT_1759101 [Mycena galopus ATCC 62051]|nr:hypothetical protein K438DRAFT_1759101 [Mycena galopus ATCC 62051]